MTKKKAEADDETGMDNEAPMDPEDLSNESWDSVTQPLPLPNIRFQFQGFAATYRKVGDGLNAGGHDYSFGFAPVAPLVAVDEDELPDDWQAQKVWVRFEVPMRATHWDAKQFFELCGIDLEGLTRNEAIDAFKKAKPMIAADVRRRSWVDKTTGVQRWAINLRKINLAADEADDEAYEAEAED